MRDLATIVGTKVRSRLIFTKDKKNYAIYDLKDGSTIKCTNGKERDVKGLNSFFQGYNAGKVAECFLDEKYRQFLNIIMSEEYRCTNVGTFLNRLRYYGHLENYIVQGVKHRSDISEPLSIYPKNIVKIFKKHDITITRDVEKRFADGYCWNYWQDEVTNEQNNKLFRKTRKLMIDSLVYLDTEHSTDHVKSFMDVTCSGYRDRFVQFSELVIKHKYEYKRLLDYVLDYLPYQEAVNPQNGFENLYDYFDMQKTMKRKGSFNKYPTFLTSVHDIVAKNYNDFEENHEEEAFLARVDRSLEYTKGKYLVLAPTETYQIKHEGIELGHCSASYIKRVMSGELQIMFLREIGYVESPLVTLCVKNGKLTQAYGLFSRYADANEKEKSFLLDYCKANDLVYDCGR